MPIKPENRALYPSNWKQISERIRFERAGNKCEWCGAENYQPHPITGSKVTLTVAHLDHNPANCADENLRALCNKCHISYDAKHHAANARETRLRNREQKLSEAGQLKLPLSDFIARYTYLGDKQTDPALAGMQCSPVRRADGKCIVSIPMATALVETVDGKRYVVLRRRLRLNAKVKA